MKDSGSDPDPDPDLDQYLLQADRDLSNTRARDRSAPPDDSSGSTHLAAAVAQLPADAVEFLGTFWPRSKSSGTTRAAKARELLATLNGGATYRGQRVQAFTPERLAAKCRDVMTEGVRDRAKAMAVLLIKLADTSDSSAPGQVAAVAEQREVLVDESQRARELVDANAWLEDHPEHESAIEDQLERDYPTAAADEIQQISRRIAREALVLRTYRGATAPDPETADV